MPRTLIVFATLVLLTALLAPQNASSQVLYGIAVGTLQDPTGAVVAGAAVSITSKETGLVRETTTGTDGNFTFSSLLPGSYELKVVAGGFRTITRTDVNIRVNSVTRVDVSLELGQVAEQVTVQGAAVALQTDKSDVSAEIPARAVENLPPSSYRNFQSLINLVPGATPAAFQNSVGSTPARALTTNMNGTARNITTRASMARRTFTSGCPTTWSTFRRLSQSTPSTSARDLLMPSRGWRAVRP